MKLPDLFMLAGVLVAIPALLLEGKLSYGLMLIAIVLGVAANVLLRVGRWKP